MEDSNPQRGWLLWLVAAFAVFALAGIAWLSTLFHQTQETEETPRFAQTNTASGFRFDDSQVVGSTTSAPDGFRPAIPSSSRSLSQGGMNQASAFPAAPTFPAAPAAAPAFPPVPPVRPALFSAPPMTMGPVTPPRLSTVRVDRGPSVGHIRATLRAGLRQQALLSHPPMMMASSSDATGAGEGENASIRIATATEPEAEPTAEMEATPIWISPEDSDRFEQLVEDLEARTEVVWTEVQRDPEPFRGLVLALRGTLLERVDRDEETGYVFAFDEESKLELWDRSSQLSLSLGVTYQVLIRLGEANQPQWLAVAEVSEEDADDAEPEVDGDYTGLIVDAQGLELKEGEEVALIAPDGRVVFGRGEHDGATGRLTKQAVAGHYTSMKAARKNNWVGERPLVVQAIGYKGTTPAGILISRADVERIEEANRKLAFLKHNRVVLVVDE